MSTFPLLLLLGLFGLSRTTRRATPPPAVTYTPPTAAPGQQAAQPFSALAKASTAARARAVAAARAQGKPVDPAEQAAVEAAVSQAVRDQGLTPPKKRAPYDAALGLAAFLKKTGRFGSKTDRPAEVALAQQDLGVEADGIVGPKTRAAAQRAGVALPLPAAAAKKPAPPAAAKKPTAATPTAATAKRSPSAAARALAAFLSSTHRFGSKTDRPAEVKAAQRDLGVTADGIVGPKTRAAAQMAGVRLPAQ